MDLKEKNLTVNWCGFHVSDLTFRVSILDFSKLLYWKNSAIHFFGGIIYSLKYSWVWPRVSSLWKAAWPSLCQLHSSLTKSFPLLGFMLRKGLRGGGCAAVFVKTLWPTTALSFGLWVLVWVGFQIFFGHFGPFTHCLQQLETLPGVECQSQEKSLFLVWWLPVLLDGALSELDQT